MSYRVVLEPRARKQLNALDASAAARIAGALRRVADKPVRAAPNVKALKGGGKNKDLTSLAKRFTRGAAEDIGSKRYYKCHGLAALT